MTWIYFVESADGYIKIGVSDDPKRRLAGLQTSTPHTLTLLYACAGGFSDECAAHRAMRPYHVRGEWFRRCDEVLVFIESMRCGERIPLEPDPWEWARPIPPGDIGEIAARIALVPSMVVERRRRDISTRFAAALEQLRSTRTFFSVRELGEGASGIVEALRTAHGAVETHESMLLAKMGHDETWLPSRLELP